MPSDRIITPGLTDLSSLTIASGDTLLAYGGTQSITAGTDLSGIDRLASVFFGSGAALNFVSTLQLGTSGTFTNQMNSGIVRYEADCTGTGANTIARIDHQGACTMINEAGGTITELNQQMGFHSVAAGTDLTTARFLGGGFEIGYDATVITTMDVRGASGRCQRGATTVNVTKGGYVRFAREVVTGTSSIACTTINVDASRVDWIGGAVTTVNLNTPDAVFHWQDMAESATIGTIAGHYAAIARAGLVQGSNTTRTGKTLTVTTLTPVGGKIADIGGMSIG